MEHGPQARPRPRAARRSDSGQAAGERSEPRVEANLLLRTLAERSRERLAPHLEPVQLLPAQKLWEPDVRIRSVYFPQTCVISLLVPLAVESPVEAATIGREGMLGMP